MMVRYCPKCGDPMTLGPLQPPGEDRVADWYCEGCHHTQWQEGS